MRFDSTHTSRFFLRHLFERSEFLIATCKKKKSVRLCGRSTNLGFNGENTNNIGFSVGYVLCTTYIRMYLVPASASLLIAGSALPPVGRATPLLY